jgi:hypothetical protein
MLRSITSVGAAQAVRVVNATSTRVAGPLRGRCQPERRAASGTQLRDGSGRDDKVGGDGLTAIGFLSAGRSRIGTTLMRVSIIMNREGYDPITCEREAPVQQIQQTSRLNSCLLIDSTVMTLLPGSKNPEECHLYLAEGCHLYIAATTTNA